MPAMYLAFGRTGRRPEDEDDMPASRALANGWPAHRPQAAHAGVTMPGNPAA